MWVLVGAGMRILSERNLFQLLKLDKVKMVNFLCRIEDAYQRYPDVHYHNNQHGADVMHSTHYLLNNPALLGAFSHLEVFTAIIAACVHDVDHQGRTNAFLIKTRHPWAILYNDMSVLENHHVATAFEIMQDPACDILCHFSLEEYVVVRKLMIDMVLSTDMAKHTKFLGEFKTLMQARQTSPPGLAAGEQEEGGVPPTPPAPPTIVEQLAENYPDRALVLCTIVHISDLGIVAKSWELCSKWTYRLLYVGVGLCHRRCWVCVLEPNRTLPVLYE